MRPAATRTTQTKKKSDEKTTDNKTTTKTKSSTTTKAKPTLGRSKTDVGTKKKTSKVAGVSSTDYENLPSYMRPTQSSMRGKTTGSLGVEEKEKEKRKTPTRIPTKPASAKKKTTKGIPSSMPTRTTKKVKGTQKSSDVERSPAPSVETPTPKEIVTEQGPDASAAVGLAPATPQTPGQDPVPHISDNDSTGGLMETVDEYPNDTCNVKQWMLFSEATRETRDLTSHVRSEGDEATVDIHDDEQGGEPSGPVESGATNEEPAQLMTKTVDAPAAEKLVTTETAVVVDDSDEEDSRQNNVDPVADEGVTAASSSEAPNAETMMESRSEEVTEPAETAVSAPPVDEADPAGMETTATAATIQQEETTPTQETHDQPSAETQEDNDEPTNPTNLQESVSAEESLGQTSSDLPKEEATNVEQELPQEATAEASGSVDQRDATESKPEPAEQALPTNPVNNQDETAVSEKEENTEATKTEETENTSANPDASTSEGTTCPTEEPAAKSEESPAAPKTSE